MLTCAQSVLIHNHVYYCLMLDFLDFFAAMLFVMKCHILPRCRSPRCGSHVTHLSSRRTMTLTLNFQFHQFVFRLTERMIWRCQFNVIYKHVCQLPYSIYLTCKFHVFMFILHMLIGLFEFSFRTCCKSLKWMYSFL